MAQLALVAQVLPTLSVCHSMRKGIHPLPPGNFCEIGRPLLTGTVIQIYHILHVYAAQQPGDVKGFADIP